MRRIYLTAALALSAVLSGCATLPNGKPTPGDPWERMNRSIWAFDNALDHAVLRPVARGYVRYTPPPVRHSINNFMTNLTYSDTAVNDFLQGKFNDGVNDVARLVVNTVLGVGGLFDPASHMDLDRHSADVGQTLGIWGLGRGPYLVLPFLGPSDVRDAFGSAADEYLTPRAYIQDQYVRWSLYLVNEIDERAGLLDQDRLIDSAYDSYAFVRDAYLQNREFKVHGEQPQNPETPEQLFPGADLGGAAGPAQPPSPASSKPPAPPGTPGGSAASPGPTSTPPPR
jgi:phospholipid-binding lipoprotein MlaA